MPKDEIAHVVKVSPAHEIVVLKPIVDTIVLTMSGEASFKAMGSGQLKGAEAYAAKYWAGFYNRVIEEMKADYQERIVPSKQRLPRYGVAADLILGEQGPRAYINTKPLKPKLAAVRLEYSPAKLSVANFNRLLDLWEDIDYDNVPLPALLADARVTRLDVAVDLLNVPIADVFVYHPDVAKVWTASSMHRGAETFSYYLGGKSKGPFVSPKKRANLIVYDKRKEQIANGKEPRFGQVPHTRVEVSLTKTSLLKNLGSTKFSFEGWQVRRAATDNPPIDKDTWRLFLDSARLRGFSAARKMVPDSKWADVNVTDPSHFPNDLLTESAIWEFWPDALQKAHLDSMISWATAGPAEFLPQHGIFS